VLRRLDHLVYAVPDLDGGVADLERGSACARRRAAASGPRHAQRADRARARSYLEILAPDPAQPVPAGGRWFGVDPARRRGWRAGRPRARSRALAASRASAACRSVRSWPGRVSGPTA
jgi:hypothetical protein